MGNLKLKQLSERVYYLPAGVNTVIVRAEDDAAILIDTGQDKTYGRELRKACEHLNLTPRAILNTHAHADHYGGNAYLLGQFDMPVYAPPLEASIMRNPYLEPVYLMNGAKPLPELMSKWLLAKPSKVDVLLEEGTLELFGVRLELISTPGHAHQQISVLVDNILIAADALFGETVLEKYPLPFGQDVEQQIASAEKLKVCEANRVLPGHGEPTEDLSGLIEANLNAFRNAADAVKMACEGGSTETVLKRVCNDMDIVLSDLARYYLNLCTVSAYLCYLRDEGEVGLELKDDQLSWQQV